MKPRKNPLCRRARAAAFAAAVLATSTAAQAQTWDAGGAPNLSWNLNTNWNPNAVPTWGNTTALTFDVPASTHSYLGNAVPTVKSITFGDAVDTLFEVTLRSVISATPGGTSRDLTFSANTGNASLNVGSGALGNITIGVGTGAAAGGGTIVLASNLDVVHNGSGELLFNRPFNGAGAFTKTGTGTFRYVPTVLSSYSGAININQGRAIFAAGSVGFDFASASAVNLGGGNLEVRTTTAVDKTLDANTTVSSAGTLTFNNTAATDQRFTVQTGTMALNANLTVQNISSSTAGNNIINITRNLTGNGNLIVDTYNNVASGAVPFSNGRVQLSGDNTGWAGNLVVAKGTAQFSGTNSFVPTAGSITLGTTGDAFGAALGFNQASTDANVSNAITVTTGGVRLIRNNSGPGSTGNISLSNSVNLQGSLTLDHAGLGAGKSITVSGGVTGAGGLNVTFVGPHQVADSAVRLTGTNDYKGETAVALGATLVVDGDNSSADGAVSVTGKLTGSGTVGGATTINSGGTHNAGDPTVAGGVGSQAFSSSLNYANGSIFEWDLNANSTSSGFDTVSATGNIDVGTATVFKVVFGAGVDLGSSFWSTPSTTESWSLASIFGKAFNSGAFSSVVSTADPITRGSFSITGTHLTWTAVPEPSSALAGLLITAGLLRRRRLGAWEFPGRNGIRPVNRNAAGGDSQHSIYRREVRASGSISNDPHSSGQ
jgi:hypothetical protein